ncbi:hypothetical protein GHK33_20255, partial [Sinorhizobium meliloti]|uniref:bifunctional DNA primase/polymerase n=1 Tax=Rhizobium meliloti TaxID=382 RepID=UPI00142ACE64
MTDLSHENGRADLELDAPESTLERSGNFENHTTGIESTAQNGSRVPTLDVKQAEEYLQADYELIRLHPLGKAALRRGWRGETLTRSGLREHMTKGGNVGVRLRAEDLVVDVDPRNGGDESFKRLMQDFPLPVGPVVITGGGGRHLYLRKPADLDTVVHLEAYPGIDFKRLGGYVVAAGSIHPETRQAYQWDPLEDNDLSATPKAPEALLAALTRPARVSSQEAGECTPEELEELLEGLDPCDFADYPAWLGVGMAAHHGTNGAGEDVFVEWSARDPIYAGHEAEVRAKWASFSTGGGRQCTIGTIHKLLNDAKRGDLVDAYMERRRPSAEDDFPDDDVDLGSLPVETSRHWASDWVWVAEAAQFVRRDDGRRWRAETWKTMHAGNWKKGDVLSAVWKGHLPVRKFESLVYLPEKAEFPDGDGSMRYNIWRKSGVEATPGDVSIFLEHMEHLFPDESDRSHVLDYLALLVQFPSSKINFALLVRGIQGTGKSWIGGLMERIIGAPNVTKPSNEEVTSRWTAWMEGAQLAVIEELMTLGRREVANRLKPAITDTTLRIEGKGLPLYSIPNYLNFICFTNHSDALPIENGDRRWLVVFSPAKKREPSYYGRLFRFLEDGGAAHVKHWLMSREVKLDPCGVAPWTAGKSEMLESSRGDAEHYLLDLFESRETPFDFDLVRLEDVIEAVPPAYRGRAVRARIVKFLKEEIGAEQHLRYTKQEKGRPAHRLWSIRDHGHWSSVGAAG